MAHNATLEVKRLNSGIVGARARAMTPVAAACTALIN
jgi:hypothetical protein